MYKWVLIFVGGLFIIGCQKKLKVGKFLVVYGWVYVYGINELFVNYVIYLYGWYGIIGMDFDVIMVQIMIDVNGNYWFEYGVVDGVFLVQIWLLGLDIELFNEMQVWINFNFQQFNFCYMQG